MTVLAQLFPLIILILAMYFLLIRPQKKREKEINTMRSNLQVGDEIITIGGICGKIVKIKDETIVIQVGAERLKFEMMKWSVSKVVNSDSSKTSSKKARPEEKEEPAKKALPKKLKRAEEKEEAPVAEEAATPAAEEAPVVETVAEAEENKEEA